MVKRTSLALVVLAGLSLGACSKKGNGGERAEAGDSVLITGKIENAPASGLIVLEEIQQNKAVPVDTFNLSENAFSEKVKVEEPGFYRLNLYNQQFITLILDDENVLVNADLASGPGTAKVEGSTDTRYLDEINNIVQNSQQQVVQLEQEFLKARSEENTVRMEELQQQYMQTETNKREAIKEKLRNWESSIAAVYAVNYLNREEDFQFLDSLATRLKADLPNSIYVQDFVQGVDKMRSSAIGQVAPEISLPNPEGEVKKLSDLRGNYVLVDFWAAWCGPCRRENPNVVKLYNKYHDQGFEVFGVSLDRKKEDWLNAIQKDGLVWTQVSDLNYFNSEAAQTYGITAIPATVLLDKEGRIIARNLRGPALEAKLEEIFSKEQ